MAILAVGFLGVILLGAVLLWLPICNQQPIAFIDALFTSVTAVCVTGLVTITPAVQFTILGKIILLILIRIGGLGIIATVAAFFLLLRKRITFNERLIMQEAYNMDGPGGIVNMVWKVLIGTLCIEGAGAIFYALTFIPEYGFLKGVGYSIFHAVSAFCNAGVDILGDSSFANYLANPLMNLTTMILIVLGGLGFIVWFDIIDNTNRVRTQEVPRGWIFTRLRLHTKIVLVMTLILILAGAGLILLMEFANPETLGPLPWGEKIMASFFHSISTRTAGFYTFSQASMHEESKLVTSILMFIGGSPGGTAGGIKTTTFAMLILTCLTVVRGGKDTECFGRKITTANFRTGFAVVMVSFSAYVAGVLIISMLEPDNILFVNIIYEAASASGTVGLTADLTPQLTRISQCVLMIMMYLGRMGPITLALLFAGKRNPRDKIRELPDENIVVS